jgi:2-phospho-L-lactate guanylyltransferase
MSVPVPVLVPVRSFARAKRRLRTRFSSAEVEDLQRALLEDVLALLAAARHVERRIVLTGDAAVAAAVRAHGAEVHWLDPDPGLNPALEQALAWLRDEGCAAALILLGDLPLLEPSHVDALIEAGQRHGLAGIASLDGGTALLYEAPPGCIPARFGPESFEAHRAAARTCGLELHNLELDDELACLDLDTPEDAHRIAASGRACRTAELLRKLGRCDP